MAKTAVKTRKLPALRHAEGCPEDPDRVEVYKEQRPDGETMTITRCVDCAASDVKAAGGSRSSEGDA